MAGGRCVLALFVRPFPFALGFVIPFQISESSFLSRGTSRAHSLLASYVFYHTRLLFIQPEWAIHPGLGLHADASTTPPRDAFPPLPFRFSPC
jgi:hypothetical protein